MDKRSEKRRLRKASAKILSGLTRAPGHRLTMPEVRAQVFKHHPRIDLHEVVRHLADRHLVTLTEEFRKVVIERTIRVEVVQLVTPPPSPAA